MAVTLDLRKYGKPMIIVAGDIGLDLTEVATNKVKVSTLVGGGTIQFLDRGQLNAFLAEATNGKVKE